MLVRSSASTSEEHIKATVIDKKDDGYECVYTYAKADIYVLKVFLGENETQLVGEPKLYRWKNAGISDPTKIVCFHWCITLLS